MEVRLRRSTQGNSSGTSDAEAGACWLDPRQSQGQNQSTPPPEEGGQNGGLLLQDEEVRPLRASQASALLAHQNLLMSPGATDRVYGYRCGSAVEDGDEDDDQGERGANSSNRSSTTTTTTSSNSSTVSRRAAAAPSSSPSAADILRGAMRFGASVMEERATSIPSSPPDHDCYRGRDAEASVPMSGSASKWWPKQQLQESQQRRQQRRRLSLLSESAHRIVCGLRLAQGDVGSIALLLVLYTLQGIPMGLSASVPFLLQERVSYKQQALFSLVSLPFSFKLIWAPIVDSTRFLGLGRRKTWLLPVQFLCGVMMLAAAPRVAGWMGDEPADTGVVSQPQVRALTAYFLSLYALMATQDIAVDGWALTMLSRENVGLASTCNTIGQTLGYFLAHVGFLALHSPETCNTFLRPLLGLPALDTGMVTLGGFLSFWGWVFLVTTVLVAFKHEDRARDNFYHTSHASASPVLATYRQLWHILQLPPVRQMCLVLLSVKAGFAVTDSATNLKLIEYGMPKEEIALMSPLLIVTGIAVPLLLTKATSGPRPLSLFLRSYAPRLSVGLLYGALLPLAHRTYASTATAHRHAAFRVLFLTVVGLREVCANASFVSQMAFFARVSDPSIGGTYMTLLNTVSNLGGSWLRTASLALLDAATLRECRALVDDGSGALLQGVRCGAEGGAALCQARRGSCVTTVDGYYVQLLACTLLGVAWLAVFRPVLLRLEALPASEWCLKPHRFSHGYDGPGSPSRPGHGAPPPFSSPSTSASISASASSSSYYYHGALSATTRRRSGDNGGGGGASESMELQRPLMGPGAGAGAPPYKAKA